MTRTHWPIRVAQREPVLESARARDRCRVCAFLLFGWRLLANLFSDCILSVCLFCVWSVYFREETWHAPKALICANCAIFRNIIQCTLRFYCRLLSACDVSQIGNTWRARAAMGQTYKTQCDLSDRQSTVMLIRWDCVCVCGCVCALESVGAERSWKTVVMRWNRLESICVHILYIVKWHLYLRGWETSPGSRL